jgi:DNA-binding transcriptional LysR family regulator
VELSAVRTFVAAAEAGRFQDAADDLAVTQQAVSKRIAGLERDLGVRLFTRTPRGVALTIDGQAFLPHARELLAAQQRAADSVRPGRRALRVDVIARRSAPGALLRGFHQAHPDAALDVVAIDGPAAEAIEAIRAGTIDASFRAVTQPGGALPAGVAVMPAVDEPLHLLTGPAPTSAAITCWRCWPPRAAWPAWSARAAGCCSRDLGARVGRPARAPARNAVTRPPGGATRGPGTR